MNDRFHLSEIGLTQRTQKGLVALMTDKGHTEFCKDKIAEFVKNSSRQELSRAPNFGTKSVDEAVEWAKNIILLTGTCINCIFWHEKARNVDTDSAPCRRFPPTSGNGWPFTCSDMWCGEFSGIVKVI